MPAPDSRTANSAPAPLATSPNAAPPASAWSNVYFDAEHVDKLVDRLTWALSEKTALVRELEAARSELAAQQQQLLDARDKAERARTTLATFLHALGHDLRAPLVSLDAGLQLLEIESIGRVAAIANASAIPIATRTESIASSTDPAWHDTERAVQLAAQDMRRTCGHGLALIHDLFELIRSDAGAWRVELAHVTLGELVSSAVSVIALQAHAKGLAIEVKWTDSDCGTMSLAQTTISTDPTRVTQALVNLLGNAVKFTPAGTISIGVALRPGTDGQQATHAASSQPVVLVLTVDDAGPGIEDALLPRIFEPFAQGEAGLRSKGGVGLGLAIVERCALLLGGTVRVANRAEGGARFTLEIPVTRTISCDIGPAVSDGSSKSLARSRTRSLTPSLTQSLDQTLADPTEGIAAEPLRVLLVDDALDAARLLEHHLRHAGASVTCAASLREARQILDSTFGTHLAFDVVITDLELGDGSGLDLANELARSRQDDQNNCSQTPFVVLSSARPASEVAQVWHGSFLPKPVSRASMNALLGSLSDRRTRS